MQDEEDRQTQEAFDSVTGEAIALTPPRVEDQALSPRSAAGIGLEPLELARPSFESALERFRSAGQTDVDPDDPALFNAYRRSLDYLGDMALGGLDLTDAAFRAAVGITAQALPEDQERSFARDLAAMPEAFMGYSPGRIQSAVDRVAEGVAQVGRNLNQPGPMPTLGSNLGNLAVRAEEPARTSGRVTNPLLRSTPRSVNFPDDRDGRILLEYYSPLVSAVEQMPIAKEGSTGQTIMAYLTKRAPNISAQELNYTLSGLDPNTRYTREEVTQLLRPSTRTGFRARVLETVDFGDDGATRYANAQRQILRDQREQDYFEILLENPGSEVNLPSHHDTDTFAHSRGSIREDEQGRYLLIEEIQSDALQNIGKVDSRDLDGTDEFVEAYLDELFDDTPYDVVYTAIQDLMNPRQGESREAVRDRIKDFYSSYDIEVSGRDARALHMDGIRKLTPSVSDDFDAADEQLTDFFDDVQSTAMDAAEQRQLESYGEGDIPFSSTQYVRQLLLANIAKAKEEGIERVVIPPIEEVARQRVGTGNLATLDDAIKALRPTYVDSIRKALNTINAESQGQIRLGSQSLPYWDMTQPDQTRRANGLLLDISNFDFNPQTQAARFAKGGMVSMEEQMSLFDMGGLTDDGAMRDPVSGNEVPPGSMASEVRDDVPAMLSEGEYIVPADVVRYYGVKFFEDLRGQAKSGMMDMERNGRIGGEPVGAPEDDLTPEEMQMLAEITGMYAGGDVRRPEKESVSVDEVLAGDFSLYDIINSPVRIRTPYGDDATTPEMKRELFRKMGLIQIAEESGNQNTRAFQEGGVVTQQDFMNQAQQAEGFRLPSSVFAPSTPTTQPTAPFTPVTLYGPTGDTMLATSQEQYNSLIAQGYTTQPRVTQPATPTGGDSGGGDGGFGTDDLEAAGGGFRLNDENFESLRNNPLAFGTEALGAELPLGASTRQVAGALSMVAGPVGMIAGGLGGAAFELDNIAKARAALEVARSQDLEGTPEFTALETRLKTAEENLTGPARLLERLGLGSGKSYINQFEEFTSTTPAAPAAARTPTGGGSGVTTTPTPAPERSSVTFASEGPARGTVQGPGQAARPGSRPAPEPGRRGDSAADVEADDAARVSAESRASAQRAAERQGTSLATRGRATGGLVAKPTKKKTVAKKK